MKKIKEPHWIRHTHLLDDDEYECSECHSRFGGRKRFCPQCGALLRLVEEKDEWLDEAMFLDLIEDD